MWSVSIENIAGIRSGEAAVERGLNVVQASNFRGKSSFVAALRTVTGVTGLFGESHPLTEGAPEGRVALRAAGETYEVGLARNGPDAVARTPDSTPYLTDEVDRTAARLFAFLDDANPVRVAVRNGDDLTALLQAPLDVEDIEAKIRARRAERDRLTDRVADAEAAEREVDAVEATVADLEAELSDLRAERATLEERAAAAPAEGPADALAAARDDLADAEARIDRLTDRVETLEGRLADRRADLDAVDVPDAPAEGAVADLEAEADRLDRQIDLLESLYNANRQVLAEDEVDLVTEVERGIADDELSCWVCGQPTTAAAIEDRVAEFGEAVADLRAERASVREESAAHEERWEAVEAARTERAAAEEAVSSLTQEVESARAELERVRARREDAADEVAELEAQVVETGGEVEEELTDVKAAIRTTESELERERDRLAELAERASGLQSLREDRADAESELRALRERKTAKQVELQERFDAAVDDVLSAFAPGFDGARLDRKTDENGDVTAFTLSVVREGRETALSSLSEGERELVGIAVAVAGHRTYDVGDRLPLVVVDGIGQLAADNLRNLVAYLDGAAERLVTTAYPEAGEFDAHTLTPAAWDVVSDRDTVSQ